MPILSQVMILKGKMGIGNRRTYFLFATGIECGIHVRQVLKYQSSVTSRLIFQDHIIIKGLHLGSHSLHIQAILSATMWAEFRSHCEGHVYMNSENSFLLLIRIRLDFQI